MLLALWAGARLTPRPAPRWSVAGLVRYGVAFLVGSLQGGIDVARRALAPRLRLSPVVIRYTLRLPTGPARHLFMGTLSLQPGTLSMTVDGDDLQIHALVDQGDELVLRLRSLEALVTRAFAEPLERSHE